MPTLDANFYTVLIAIISLMISIGHISFTLLTKRRNIEIEVNNCKFVDFLDSEMGQYALEILVINKSQNPISINYIEFFDKNNKSYKCSLLPSLHFHHFQKMIDTNTMYEKFIESTPFPIRLDSQDAKLVIFYLHFPIKATVAKCLIYTNKGNPIKCDQIKESCLLSVRYRNGERYDTNN